jgi:hypothetical protein
MGTDWLSAKKVGVTSWKVDFGHSNEVQGLPPWIIFPFRCYKYHHTWFQKSLGDDLLQEREWRIGPKYVFVT